MVLCGYFEEGKSLVFQSLDGDSPLVVMTANFISKMNAVAREVSPLGEYDKIHTPIARLFIELRNSAWDEKKFILGKVLTIIDGCIVDKKQNKATKDMINEAFWGASYWTHGIVTIFKQFVRKYCPDMDSGAKYDLHDVSDGKVNPNINGDENCEYFKN